MKFQSMYKSQWDKRNQTFFLWKMSVKLVIHSKILEIRHQMIGHHVILSGKEKTSKNYQHLASYASMITGRS